MSRYNNPKVNELFKEAEQELDQDKRAQEYNEAVDMIFEDCPSLPIFNKEIPYAWNKNLNAVTHLNSEQPWFVYEWSWNE